MCCTSKVIGPKAHNIIYINKLYHYFCICQSWTRSPYPWGTHKRYTQASYRQHWDTCQVPPSPSRTQPPGPTQHWHTSFIRFFVGFIFLSVGLWRFFFFFSFFLVFFSFIIFLKYCTDGKNCGNFRSFDYIYIYIYILEFNTCNAQDHFMFIYVL